MTRKSDTRPTRYISIAGKNVRIPWFFPGAQHCPVVPRRLRSWQVARHLLVAQCGVLQVGYACFCDELVLLRSDDQGAEAEKASLVQAESDEVYEEGGGDHLYLQSRDLVCRLRLFQDLVIDGGYIRLVERM